MYGLADGDASSISHNEESVPVLLKQMAHNLMAVTVNEVAEARAEIKENAAKARSEAVFMGAGAIVMLAAVIVLLLGCVDSLAQFIAPWLASTIVGGAALMISFVMIRKRPR